MYVLRRRCEIGLKAVIPKSFTKTKEPPLDTDSLYGTTCRRSDHSGVTSADIYFAKQNMTPHPPTMADGAVCMIPLPELFNEFWKHGITH